MAYVPLHHPSLAVSFQFVKLLGHFLILIYIYRAFLLFCNNNQQKHNYNQFINYHASTRVVPNVMSNFFLHANWE